MKQGGRPPLLPLLAALLASLAIYSYNAHRTHWQLLFASEKYHGPPPNGKSFIEGWYYKLVSADERYSVAVVPGVFYGNHTGGDHHSFIFFNLHGPNNLTADLYYRFDVGAVVSDKDAPFNIRIQDSQFSLNKISFDIKDQGGFGNASVQGSLAFTNLVPWPASSLFPSIMGPLQYLPFLNCYHGLLSMNHDITGYLKVNDIMVDMSGGKGYTEKDYGTAFPKSWIWMQTNHFDSADVSLFVAVADVPIIASLNIRLPMGIIGGIYVKGKFYEFASYLLSSIDELILSEHLVSFTLHSFRYSLRISIDRDDVDSSSILFAPCGATMCRYVPEALNAKVNATLVDKWKHQIVFAGTGKNAGLEVVGDVQGNYDAYRRYSPI
jgi:tocopherol cyclase